MPLLKQETELLHQRLEKLPYFIALSNGTLPLASYVNQLRAFATAFGTLEHEIATIRDSSLRAVLGFGESRFSQLLRDFSCFADKMIPEIIEVKRHADAMAARIRLLGREDPISLIGYAYALKGTLLGNRVHLPDVQRTFNVDGGTGAAFYSGYGEGTDEHWTVFASLVNSFDTGAETTELILAAAREAFGHLEYIHTALFPLPSADDMALTATSLNPEAGDHEVPAGEMEIAAALEAGRLCREEFPYFDARYGERGKRFTDSDAAWLATLRRLMPPQIVAQVAWLGGVLASRGMPRITMERQLFHLHKELVRAIPGNKDQYDQLLDAMEWLHQERLRHIPTDVFDSLCRSFAARTINELGGNMKGTGSLIVSAVCDEKAGIGAAVTSLETWLTNAGQFSADWIAAVRETIAQARSAAV